MPRWGTRLGFRQLLALCAATGDLPITGGLFLGDELDELLSATDRFRLSQDQPHTVRGRISVQSHAVDVGGAGAPPTTAGCRSNSRASPRTAIEQYGERIVDRVDFETGRVRPSFSLDASAGLRRAKSARAGSACRSTLRNLTNRLNVINFAGLFSGTALAAPRSVAVRLQAEF